MNIEFLTDRDIYEKIILGIIPYTKKILWIGTADIKDIYISHGLNKKMVPFFHLLSKLVKNGVSIRILHAKEPGPNFRRDFDKYPELFEGIERMCCPRVHFKTVIVDGIYAYSGSANLTGAGMGAKSTKRRNFESGFLIKEKNIIDSLMDQFDKVWMGHHCKSCLRKPYCSEYRFML